MEKVSDIRQNLYTSRHFPGITLRTTCSSRQPYAAHFHETLSLGVVFQGQTQLSTLAGTTRVHCGEMIFIAPHEVHRCNPIDGLPRSYHMFYFDFIWIETLFRSHHVPQLRPLQQVITEKRTFTGIMNVAKAFHNNSVTASDMAFLSGVLQKNLYVPAAASYIAPLPVRDGTSREWRIRSYRRTLGITPGGYAQCLRLNKAARMLQAGEDISRTAADCGFADQSHLHRMCVKYLAATPGQLRIRG